MNYDLNVMAAEIHAANIRWWHDLETGERLDRNKGEMLMLIVSELSEAMEGERKNLRDDHLPSRMMAEVELGDVLIRTLDFAGGFNYPLWKVESALDHENKGEFLLGVVRSVCMAATSIEMGVEDRDIIGMDLSYIIADVYAYAAKFGYDVDGAMAEKRAYNATRHDHSREARLAANGKKF